MTFPRFIAIILFALTLAAAAPVVAQEHAQQPVTQQLPTEQGAQPAHPAQTAAGHPEAAEAEHPNEALSVLWRLLNFAILVGTLVYFLKSTVVSYLATRGAQIRQELVTASEMRTAASSQLADIQKRMATLPGELEALRTQGAADVKSEQARIAEAATHERERLLTQTRREIDTRLRIAKRELTEHAAMLAVQVAEQRIKREITPDDQVRLIDRYSSQLREAR